MRPSRLVAAWLAQPGIRLLLGAQVARIGNDQGRWSAFDTQGRCLATGDRIVIAASATAGLAVVLWSWWRPDAMAFRIYPELEVPVVEPVLMLLLSLLMAAAVVAVVPERAR